MDKQTKKLENNKVHKDNELSTKSSTKSKTKSGINKSTSKSKVNNHTKAKDTHTNKEAKSNQSTKDETKNNNQHHKQALKRLKHREKIACRVLATMCALIIGYCCFDAYITRGNNPSPQEIAKQEKASQHGYGYTLSSKPKHKFKARNRDTSKNELNGNVNKAQPDTTNSKDTQTQPTNYSTNRANN